MMVIAIIAMMTTVMMMIITQRQSENIAHSGSMHDRLDKPGHRHHHDPIDQCRTNRSSRSIFRAMLCFHKKTNLEHDLHHSQPS